MRFTRHQWALRNTLDGGTLLAFLASDCEEMAREQGHEVISGTIEHECHDRDSDPRGRPGSDPLMQEQWDRGDLVLVYTSCEVVDKREPRTALGSLEV
jgi:hypothetical protein